MDMNTQIRAAAQNALKEKGWTQEQLAQAAGIKQATVSRLLTGERGKGKGLEAVLATLGLELIAVPVGTALTPSVDLGGQ